jgi:tRNA(Ile2) C34 agmatinyltransferase TiaS
VTYEELQDVNVEADRLMKLSNGHRFFTILKTRCQNCGRSTAAKGRCGGWFQTFLAIQAEEMIRRGFIERPSQQHLPGGSNE